MSKRLLFEYIVGFYRIFDERTCGGGAAGVCRSEMLLICRICNSIAMAIGKTKKKFKKGMIKLLFADIARE